MFVYKSPTAGYHILHSHALLSSQHRQGPVSVGQGLVCGLAQ